MTVLAPDAVLELLPQQRPFRFVDRIVSVDEDRIVGVYTWKKEDCLSLPGQLFVPQSSIVEMAAQIGTVSWCLYHMALRDGPGAAIGRVGLFTELSRARFSMPVRAGATLSCSAILGEEGYFRGNKLVSEVTVSVLGGRDDGHVVFTGVLSGMFVPVQGAS